MNRIGKGLQYGSYGIVILFAGGMAFYLGVNIIRDIHTKNKASDIDFKVHTCFDKKTHKEFYEDVWDVEFQSTMSSEETRICVQKRWELDGKWQKALEERC